MQGFIKQDIGPKGEACEFHTITIATVDFSKLPDQDGNGAAMSTIRVSTFVSKSFYDANQGNAELAVKHRYYGVDLMTLVPFIRYPDGQKSVEQHAYEIIMNQDSWFADATVVE
jgi:hypothetical protein